MYLVPIWESDFPFLVATCSASMRTTHARSHFRFVSVYFKPRTRGERRIGGRAEGKKCVRGRVASEGERGERG